MGGETGPDIMRRSVLDRNRHLDMDPMAVREVRVQCSDGLGGIGIVTGTHIHRLQQGVGLARTKTSPESEGRAHTHTHTHTQRESGGTDMAAPNPIAPPGGDSKPVPFPSRNVSSTPFTGAVQRALVRVDFTFHPRYAPSRVQQVHLPILRVIFRDHFDALGDCATASDSSPFQRTACWMAGAMGVGKSHLRKSPRWREVIGCPPPSTTGDSSEPVVEVCIDPDEIKTMLPENAQYIAEDPLTAGGRLHSEASYLTDLAMWMAFECNCHFVLQGTLKDAGYYSEVCRKVQVDFPAYRIVIVHMQARIETILARAARREAQTHRHVPEHVIIDAHSRVPLAVLLLTPLVERVVTIWNDSLQPSTTPLPAGPEHPSRKPKTK
jgi:hypothetical protein